MKLQVTIRVVYGVEKIYPACEMGKKFIEALGLKTFTQDAINAAKALGAEFEQILEKKEI